jgi:hypothetical protein
VSDAPLPDILTDYLNGEAIDTLCARLGVSQRTLMLRLQRFWLTATGQEYEALITQALAHRVAEADWELSQANTKVSVARTMALARFARVDFERRRPSLYGPKQEITEDKTIRVIVKREREEGEHKEGEKRECVVLSSDVPCPVSVPHPAHDQCPGVPVPLVPLLKSQEESERAASVVSTRAQLNRNGTVPHPSQQQVVLEGECERVERDENT